MGRLQEDSTEARSPENTKTRVDAGLNCCAVIWAVVVVSFLVFEFLIAPHIHFPPIP